MGILRTKLREAGIAENTIVWFCSDNGGLGDVHPTSVDGLRDFKGSLYEGGLRVPAIIEWPGQIEHAVTTYPASTMDIFPTIADIVGLPDTVFVNPVDGQSIIPVWEGNKQKRDAPIPFRFLKGGALVDNDFKIVSDDRNEFRLYNLSEDPDETTDVSETYPDEFEKLVQTFMEFNQSVERSIAGLDYPEKEVTDSSHRHFWMNDPRYEPYLDEWVQRWEYKERIER